MKLQSHASALALALLAVVPLAQAARSVSDILPPDRRRAVVERAEQLANPPATAAVPDDLPVPFNPVGFEQPDPSEARDRRPAAGAAESTKVPEAPLTDREMLAAVAARIPTTGTIIAGGRPLLISGTNRIEAGSLFTVVYNGQEYELELVAIDRTTFTVRYKGEEFTRPIKIGKNQ